MLAKHHRESSANMQQPSGAIIKGTALGQQDDSRERVSVHRHLRRLLALVACALLSLTAVAMPPVTAPPAIPAPDPATATAGLPFIQSFSPADYRGAAQNWSITQDRDGLIYVGNVESGVLVYDGARWRRIPVPNHAAVRSLALGSDGRIYVGTVGDLGYLERGADGQLGFVSLLGAIPPADRHFADVWSIHATAKGVYFTTLDHVFFYAHGTMQVWKSRTSFHLSFLVDGTLYIREVGRGLLQMAGDELQLVPGTEAFADEKIYALLPWRGDGATPGDLLVGTRHQGWFIWHAGTLRPWHSDAAAQIQQNALYSARWLDDGRLAVTTLRGGLFLLDTQGRLLRHLSHANGLRSDMLLGLLQGRHGGLWLATGNGIARIGVDAPLTVFDARTGLRGEVQALHRYAGALYAGTTEGLFRLRAGVDAGFEEISQAPAGNWDLAKVDGDLLAAGDEGVVALHDDPAQHQLDATRIVSDKQLTLALQPSRLDPDRVFVGYANGFGALRHTPQGWIDEGRIPGIDEEIRTIEQAPDGDLWLSPWIGGLIRLTLPPHWNGPQDAASHVAIARYGVAAGLPEGLIQVVRIDHEVRFITSRGIYHFNPASAHFTPDPEALGMLPDSRSPVDSLYQDHHGTIWATVANSEGIRQTGLATHDRHGWHWSTAPLQPLAGTGANAFLDDDQHDLWLGTDNGVYRYRRDTPEAAMAAPFRTLLRLVGVQGGDVWYNGVLPAGGLHLAHDHNAIRFEFAAASYTDPAQTSYTVWLQGLDKHWSPWSSDAYRDYTSLPPGRYRFHVRARNVFGQEGNEATFDFRILPPWYLTSWAWLLWIAAGVFALWLLLRWRSATLHKRNQALALLVAQRTDELAQANQALQEANEALAQQAVTDPLTGLKNRRYLRQSIEGELAGAAQLVLLMVDIDHFKRVNDEHGHAAGDLVLQQLRDILLATTRESDTTIRRGGEEFLIVARSIAPDDAAQFAERLRATVAAHVFELGEGRRQRITCSIGFACFPFYLDAPEQLTWEQVINLADMCLYAAKRGGRDAWMGIAPMRAPLAGDAVETLRTTLERHPAPGPLPLVCSWAQGG